MSILQGIKILWLRTILALTSLRFWAILFVSIASVGQLGLAPIPGMPVSQQQARTAIDDAGSWADNATTREDLNETQIEAFIHEDINDRRQAQGLQPLNHDPGLREIARYHSRDMVERNYYAHDGPAGETMGDRYDKFGYSCRVATSGNQYMAGAENIAYTYAYIDVEGPNGKTVHHDSEQDIARGLVNQWMNSTGHRENILKPYWNNEGIGINITKIDGETRIYATQNFC